MKSHVALIGLLFAFSAACSDESQNLTETTAGAGGGGSGGAAIAGGSGGTAGAVSSSGGAAGSVGGVGGKSGSSGGSSGGSGAGSGGDAGSSGAGTAGSPNTGGAAGAAGAGGAAGQQGMCMPPPVIGSCFQGGYCINYYATLGLDLKGDCQKAYGGWFDGPCIGNPPGWCEKPGAGYSATIVYYDITLVGAKGSCSASNGVWCDGKAALRPECAEGGDVSAGCASCLAAAEASGGCCEAQTQKCRADTKCSAAIDCVAACTDYTCFKQCLSPDDAYLIPETLACLYGSTGRDRGACADACPIEPGTPM